MDRSAMNRIDSFCVDHTRLTPGIYVSRQDGDIITYDIRMRRPNEEPVMDNAAMHTIEHLFATFVRNAPLGERVIYFGPMGCRTGFYFLLRDTNPADAITLIQNALQFIAVYRDVIPGTSAVECGNYRDHDLAGARSEAAQMMRIVESWGTESLSYPTP